MSRPELEAFLARLYVDASARELFLRDPRGEAARAGLSQKEVEDLASIDRDGLILAARSFERKRRSQAGRRKNPRLLGRLLTRSWFS